VGEGDLYKANKTKEGTKVSKIYNRDAHLRLVHWHSCVLQEGTVTAVRQSQCTLAVE